MSMPVARSVLLSVFIAVSAAKGELDLPGVVAFVPLALWGPLLAGSAMAYYYRRRDACTRCAKEPVNLPDAQPPVRA